MSQRIKTLKNAAENPTTRSNPSVDRNAASGRLLLEKMVKIMKQLGIR